MNSEKIKEIKKALEYCGYGSCLSCEKYSYILDGCNIALIQDALTLINELESELEKEQINNLNCDTELQYKEKRIAELEKENKELLKENEGYHGSYRCAIDKIGELSAERYIKVEKFAERLKEKAEYDYLADYNTNDEPFIEKPDFLRIVDETLKEFINEKAKI